jgi:hypothetical protein
MGKKTTITTNQDNAATTQTGNAVSNGSAYAEEGAILGGSGALTLNTLGERAIVGGSGAITVNSLDKDFAQSVLNTSAAYNDKATELIKSTIEANNALSVGSLTSLRDALSATLDAPQLEGSAADSGSVKQWVQRNPALAALLFAGGLYLAAQFLPRK